MKALFKIDGPVMVYMSKLFDLIAINVLCIFLSIPVFTIGSVYTAMYRLYIDAWRGNEPASCIKTFLKYFRLEFKTSTTYWIVNLVIILILGTNWIFLKYYSFRFKFLVQFLLLVISIISFLATLYIYPLLSRFNNTVSNTVINACVMGISNLFHSICISIIYIIPFVVIFLWPRFTVIFSLLGISLPAYINSKTFSNIIKKYEDKGFTDGENEE